MKKLHIFQQGVPEDFDGYTDAPADTRQAARWQEKNRAWWSSNPMRYDWLTDIDIPELTPEFFAEVDRRFFTSVAQAHPWKRIPFDDYIDYEWIRDKSVLEIGVGCGTHALLLARHAGQYTGVDLTEYAIKATTKRLQMQQVPATLKQMDAERLEFPDASFDFVWSWGVIHHSSNTRRILSEIARVLQPGGRCTVMVYHNSVWNTYVRAGLYYGVLKGGFLRGKSVAKLLQESTDGAIARFYKREEWSREAAPFFRVDRTEVIGHKTQLIPVGAGRLKVLLGHLIPDSFGRWLTNRPFFGYMLVAEMVKA